MTTVLLSRTAAGPLFTEVQRWVEHGLQAGGSPLESLMYPLSALVPRERRLLTPLESVEADNVAEIVIDGVAIPPDDVKNFSAANCHFSGDIDGANASFNAQIDGLLAATPRLGVHSKLHTHPFSEGAFLSSGDLYHGVDAPKARFWRQRRGLGTAILHVVYPDGQPGPSAEPWRLTDEGALGVGARGQRILWRIHSWASVDQQGQREMRDLGDARIVQVRHPSVKAARRTPYWRKGRGARWCDSQKEKLRAAGYGVSRNLLGRGWRRYLIDTAERQLLVALPADYPELAPRVLEVRRAWCDDFAPLSLPASWRPSFAKDALVSLVRYFGGPKIRADQQPGA